jgi:hypothetical protein
MPCFARFWPKSSAHNSFRIHTYKKALCNPFRIRTYEKTGGEGDIMLTSPASFPKPVGAVLLGRRAPATIHVVADLQIGRSASRPSARLSHS